MPKKIQNNTPKKDLKKSSLIFSSKIIPFIVLGLIVIGFFWKVFLGLVPLPADFGVGVYYPWLDYKWGYATGVPVKNPITTDVVSYIYPMQTYAIGLMKSGKLPLWNPFILTGNPLLANFQSAPFSPTNIVYFLFDKNTAWSIQIILAHCLAALFTYLLLRHWKVSISSSVLGSIIFSFSGFNLIWSQWNGHTLAAAFIPLLIFLTDKWLVEKNWKYLPWISLSICMQIFSGYPQVVLYTLMAIGVLWLIRLAKNKDILTKSLYVGIFIFLGLTLSSVQILPGAELLSLSQRTVEPLSYEWTFLPWSKVITFIAPDFFGNHATSNYWGPQDYTSNTGFVGIIAVLLSFLTIKNINKRREISFGWGVLALSLIFAFPTPLSVFLWKSGLLGFNAASAHRSLVLFNLSVGILAAFGFDYLLNNKINLKKIVMIFIPLFTFLAGAGFYAISKRGFFDRGINVSSVGLRNLILPFLILILSVFVLIVGRKFKRVNYFLIILCIFELFYFGWKFTPFSPRRIVFPTTPTLDFLDSKSRPFRILQSSVIPVNLHMPYGIESIEGYDAVYSQSIAQLIAAINGGVSENSPMGRYGTVDNISSPVLDLLNVKYYLAQKYEEGKAPFNLSKFKVAFQDKSVTVIENKSVLPRAFIVYDWDLITDTNLALKKLIDKDFDYKNKIIIDEPISASRAKGEGEAKYQEYDDQESIIRTTSTKTGLLFVSDLWYPGWKAYLDGIETKILKADYAFRAVKIPAGTHEVKFIYTPESFIDGLKISIFTLVVLSFSSIWAYTRRK